MIRLAIVVDDLSGPEIAAFLAEHVQDMRAITTRARGVLGGNAGTEPCGQRVTLPALMQDVQTFRRRGVLPTMTRLG